jgi:hypothetical protein
MARYLLLMLLAFAVPAAAQSEFDQSAGILLGEAALRNQLRDPESAEFSWPYAFHYGTFRLGRLSADGWITCGLTNAKNGFGGYTGREATLVLVRADGTVVALIDRPGFRLLAKRCGQMGMPVE